MTTSTGDGRPGDAPRSRAGTSLPGHRHRRDARLSVPALVLVVLGGGLALLLRQPAAPGARTASAAELDVPASLSPAAGGQARTASPQQARTASPKQARTASPKQARTAAPRSGRPKPAAGGGGSIGSATRAVTGRAVATRWGEVQVRLTMRGGRIVAAVAVQQTDAGATSAGIDARALPVLYRETVTANSAHIDAVSGATVTSSGYRESVQSALDESHLG